MSENIVKDQCEAIGNIIENTIKAKQLQKNKVAQACGISVNTLNNAIAGKNPNLSTVLGILSAIGLNLETISYQLGTSKYNIPGYGLIAPEDDAVESNHPEINVEGVAGEVAETSVEQTALRMGTDPSVVQSIIS